MILIPTWPIFQVSPAYKKNTQYVIYVLPLLYDLRSVITQHCVHRYYNPYLPQAQTIKPYEPPNLVQHLAAAIMAECEFLQYPASVFLIPTRQMALPPPTKPTEYNTSDGLPPNLETLQVAALGVSAALGISLDELGWVTSRVNERSTIKAKPHARHLHVNESSMYI